jgi:hypothetical protein
MKTFEQYITESGLDRVNRDVIYYLEQARKLITAPPFNFTWTLDLQKVTNDSFIEWDTVASRSIKLDDNEINHRELETFTLQLNKQWQGSLDAPDVARLTGPGINFDPRRPYNFNLDLDKFRMFYIDERQWFHLDFNKLFQVGWNIKDLWNIYNYYESLTDSKSIKIVKTVEFIKKNSNVGTIGWSDDMDVILSQLRVRYPTDSEPTDDDYALNAAHNL